MQAISKVLIALAITAYRLPDLPRHRSGLDAWQRRDQREAFRRRRSSAGEHSGLRFGQLPRR